MILVNQPHQLLKPVLRLQSLLLRLAVLVSFLLVDRLFVLITILRLVEPDLNGDEVRVHAVDHVLSLAFDHFGLVVLVFDRLELVEGVVEAVCLAANTVLDGRLVDLRLLQLPLLLLKLSLLG